MKYTDSEILDIIQIEMDNASGNVGDAVERNRQDALAYYLGDKGEVPEGRSSLVSTDVADSIEWIMPEVMKAFTQNNEVVTFDPVSAADRQQAEMESRFVYDILMKDNDGFITLHTFFKDALLQKNGIVKIFYEDSSEVKTEAYTGLTQPEVQMLLSDPHVELTGMTKAIYNGIEIHDVNVKRTILDGCVRILPVPPENFRVNQRHNSVNLSTARFCCDVSLKTKSDLIEAGFDKDVIESLPTQAETNYSDRTYRWGMQGENVTIDPDSSDENVVYDVTECYMKLDLNGDGVAEKLKITVAGFDNPSAILSIEEVECWPYVSVTGILMSHKFFGLSLYDRLREIQRAKTALIRNIMDNMYLQNNQRLVVQENMVNLDDLLVSRPGGIVRAKSINAVAPLPTTSLSADVYRMMDYLDQTRAGRAGVSPEGSIHDSAMGDSVGSQGLDQLLSQKEELVGLIIRVFAETGVKPICCRIRDLLIKHRNVVDSYDFRGQWVQVDPSTWKARKRTTIRVGTGSGNRKEQAAAILQILNLQSQILQNPSQALVREQEIFAAINDYAKVSGMPGAAPYLLDPTSPDGQSNKQQIAKSNQQAQMQELKEKQLLADTQERIAQAEQTKASAAMQSVQLKAENESLKNQIAAQQNEYNNQLAALQHQLEEARVGISDDHHAKDLQFKYYQTDTNAQLQREQMHLRQSGANDGSKKKQID